MSSVANEESSLAPQKNGKQLEYKQVELSAISGFDPAVAELAHIFLDAGPLSFAACHNGLGVSVTKTTKATLTHETLAALQCVAPIIVTRLGKHYRCVAGFHTLNLARQLDPDLHSQIWVLVLPARTPEKLRKSFALTTLLVMVVGSAHAWIHPQVLGSVWGRVQALESDLLAELLPQATSQRGIARLRGVAYNTMFPPAKGTADGGVSP
jgi:hypothetical protein